MIIGVLSDTHDKQEYIRAAFELLKSAEVAMVFHCGDWKSLSAVEYIAWTAAAFDLPMRGVLGNNDLAVVSMLQFANMAPGDFAVKEGVLEQTIDDKLVAVYHGHHGPTLRKLLANESYDIVLLGHTHKPLVYHLDGKLIVNPGSTAFAIPRSKLWRPTLAVVDTYAMTAEIKYII